MAAQKQVDQAKAEKEQADKALETAKANQEAADQAVIDAQKAYDTCKAATDKATTAEAQSVIGFYQFIGANDAANIIYRQSDKNPTNIGEKKTARHSTTPSYRLTSCARLTNTVQALD